MEVRNGNWPHGRKSIPFRALIDAILSFVGQLLNPPDFSRLDPATITLRKALRRFQTWQVMIYDGYKLESTTELSGDFAFATARLLVLLGTILTDGLPSQLIEYFDLWEKRHSLRFLLSSIRDDMVKFPMVKPSYLSDEETMHAVVNFFICPVERSLEDAAGDIECFVTCLESLYQTMEDIWNDAQVAARTGAQPYCSILSKWAQMLISGIETNDLETGVRPYDMGRSDSTLTWNINDSISHQAPGAKLDRLRFIMTSSRDRYVHKELPEGYKTRLLRLHPGRMDEPVHCTLVAVQDLSTIEYEAISYYWGMEDPEDVINIFDALAVRSPADSPLPSPLKPKQFLIRPNLMASLKNFRDEDIVVVFWIDAICINQFDRTEKAAQIEAMPEIFNKAANVRIWLGSRNSSTDKALDFVEHAAGRIFGKQDTMMTTTLYNNWKTVIRLMEHKYFTRRWLVQELALSRKASLHSGRRRISWPDFALVISYLNNNIQGYKEMSRAVYGSYDETISSIPALGATVLARLTQQDPFFRKRLDGTISEKVHTLEYLVSALANFDASDPRDTVYAFKALASNASRLEINYEKSTVEVFKDFVAIAIADSGCLDVICRPWAPVIAPGQVPVSPKLPSWMPSVENLPFRVSGQAQDLVRFNGDSLVGLPGKGRYAASGHTRAEVRFGNGNNNLSPDIAFGVLCVKGFRLATVGLITGRVVGGIVPRDIRSTMADEFAKSMDGQVHGFDEALWRTLVADRGADGNKAPFWFFNAFHNCWPDRKYDFDTKAAMNSKDVSPSMVEFLDRVQSVTWNRKVFITRSKLHGVQRLGLAPSNAREGDTVCVLYGCSVPVILRKVTHGTGMCYELIGPCFLYGMMDGEALTCVNQEKRVIEFEIR